MNINSNKYTTHKGVVENTGDNILVFLNNDSSFTNRLRYNTYTDEPECDGGELTDEIYNRIAIDVERGLGFYAPKKVRAVIDEFFADPVHQYHPVKDYLKSLAWDGNKRLETMYIDWLKAEDTPLTRAITKKWMIGAVKRIMEPGCKFDNVVVLKGVQGIGKSVFCERLSAGFGVADSINIEDPKDYVPLLNTSWICIMNEMRGFTKKEQETIKDFLSKREDKVRLAYRSNAKTYKRHCVFIGSTNNEAFLNDYSQMTERRYWIIKCNATDRNNIFSNFTKEIVDQLWAEAYYMYKKDPDCCLDLEDDLYEELKEDQKQYKTFTEDPAYEFLKDILSRKYPSREFMDDQFMRIVERPSEYNGIYEIDKIPVRFINNVLASNKCISARSAAWLKTVMEELGWKKVTCNYKATGKNELCWKRADSSGLFSDEE